MSDCPIAANFTKSDPDEIAFIRESDAKKEVDRIESELAIAREALVKIGGTDEIFEKEEFILCACEESHAYMQMNKRRRNTARTALAALSGAEPKSRGVDSD